MNPKIIVAMAEDRVIGRDNKMPWYIPEDLAWFKQHTLGGPVIMGKNTLLSMGGTLVNRENIVLSRDPDFSAENATVLHSLDDALMSYPDAFIIGGASIFAQALPLVNTLYITHIHAWIAGDSKFPDFYPEQWDKQVVKELKSVSGYELSFCIYNRKSR
ncbi:MAG: dihydrofolate reductase [Candidatus Cloacimonetes bacterium]|nr:dihydrofolate reductase [Candidatus Cloacimonadota bacterium]MDD2507057.1 dihydrofolate reductase [Candidatus Cloacimonadota bacterium]MDD4560310.1 dihydrofolate reductase [Candidatus Cloacimonadota bacterium]